MQFISDKYRSFILHRLAEVFGIIFFGLSIFLFGLLFSYSPLDPSFNNITDQEPLNIFGITGASIADISIQIFGSASYLFLFFLLTWAYRLIIFKKLPFFAINFFAAIISILILDLGFLIYGINVFHGFISSSFFINFIEILILDSSYFIIIISFNIILFFIFFLVSCALTFNDWKKIIFRIWLTLKIIFRNIYYVFNKIVFKKTTTIPKTNKAVIQEKVEPKIDFDSIKNESVSNYINTDAISAEISQKKMSFQEDDNYVPPIIDILSSPKTTTGSLVSKGLSGLGNIFRVGTFTKNITKS